jgi:hypothetical protein
MLVFFSLPNEARSVNVAQLRDFIRDAQVIATVKTGVYDMKACSGKKKETWSKETQVRKRVRFDVNR